MTTLEHAGAWRPGMTNTEHTGTINTGQITFRLLHLGGRPDEDPQKQQQGPTGAPLLWTHSTGLHFGSFVFLTPHKRSEIPSALLPPPPVLPEKAGERVRRRPMAASTSSVSGSSSGSSGSSGLTLPAQELLYGGQIPRARRLQQLLLFPHLRREREREPPRHRSALRRPPNTSPGATQTPKYPPKA